MPATDPDLAFCLQGTGRNRTGWDTLVIGGAAGTTLPAGALWAVWADLEEWPAWSPLHRAVTAASPGPLAAGAAFDQQLGLGFPVGTTTEHVTIGLLEPARRASWSGSGNGIRSCHLWNFTPLPGGGTHVSNTEAFGGLPAAMLRPLVARRWNRAFQGAVDGLIRHAEQAGGTTGGNPSQ